MRWYNFIIIILLTIVSSCGKDCSDVCNPECKDYDPCKCTPKTSADFKMEIQAGYRWFEIDLISPSCPPYVRFTAKDSTADEYLWEIGADTFQTRSCVLGCFPKKTNIPIKLTVKRKRPNTSCHPNDKGFDSLTKFLYSADIGDAYIRNNTSDCSPKPPENTIDKTIIGKFRGYNKSNPNKIFDMEYIKFKSMCKTETKKGVLGLVNNWIIPTVDIVNLPYEGNSVHKSFFVENKYANFTNVNSASADGLALLDGEARGDYQVLQAGYYLDEQFKDSIPLSKYYGFFKFYAYLDAKDKDKLTFEYWYRDTITRRIRSDVFIGTRVP